MKLATKAAVRTGADVVELTAAQRAAYILRKAANGIEKLLTSQSPEERDFFKVSQHLVRYMDTVRSTATEAEHLASRITVSELVSAKARILEALMDQPKPEGVLDTALFLARVLTQEDLILLDNLRATMGDDRVSEWIQGVMNESVLLFKRVK